MKADILVLMKKEQAEKISFLSKERISELINKFQESILSDEEKREIADHILANYLGDAAGNQTEDLIDWLLKDVE
jgi:DNA-binding protein Fis